MIARNIFLAMNPVHFKSLIVAGLLGTAMAGNSSAKPAKSIAGPVEADVIRIIDGDTFLAEALIWPGQTIRISVRIRGIDAPEKRAKCDSERDAAAKAGRTLAALLRNRPVRISNIVGGKYYGRVLADVDAGDIGNVAAILLARAVVRPYLGGRRRSLCG